MTAIFSLHYQLKPIQFRKDLQKGFEWKQNFCLKFTLKKQFSSFWLLVSIQLQYTSGIWSLDSAVLNHLNQSSIFGKGKTFQTIFSNIKIHRSF